MTEYVRKAGSRESLEIASAEGTTIQVLISSDEAPNYAFRKIAMAPDGSMPKHTNLVEHEQYVLHGSGVIEISDEAFEVSVGDAVYIPCGVSHSYKAGKDGFEFICVVPNKEDKIELLE